MSIDGGLRPLFRTKLRRGFQWQSIETGGTGLGIPDSNFCSEGVERWVEFKQTEAWAVPLSPEQVGWHKTRHARRGLTLIATRRWHDGGPRKGAPVDELWIHTGEHVSTLYENGLKSAPAVGIWHGGPEAWDWEAVGDALKYPTGRLAHYRLGSIAVGNQRR